MIARARRQPSVKAQPQAQPRRWLLFVHQLPAAQSNLRVHTWRRLQQLGALPVKQSVYVLPDTAATREDFEWLKTQVKAKGGDAALFAAASLDQSDDDLVEEFRRSRQEAYLTLAAEIERALAQRRRGGSVAAARRASRSFGERQRALERIDYFGSAGRDRVVALLRQLNEPATVPTGRTRSSGRGERPGFRGRLWVTRPRPGVDRMSSAWLIRRFIDPDARFAFVPDAKSISDPETIPFDMFGVEFTHHADDCTFETLCVVFEIEDKAVARIAMLVHDLDLKDRRFGAPDAATVGALIDGLRKSTADDSALLESGITMFEALYQAFTLDQAASRPRPVAKRRPAGSRKPGA